MALASSPIGGAESGLYAPALRRAQERPHDLAFRLLGRNETVITNSGLVEGALRYYAILRCRGVKRGGVVVLMLDHGADQYFGFIGAMLAGAIPTFMPPLTSRQTPALYWSAHATLFKRIKPAALIARADRVSDLTKHISVEEIALISPEEATDESPGDLPAQSANLDDLALLQHSSGTTQLKKGVELTHRIVLSQVRAYSQALDMTSGDRIASWLPLYHDMGLIACFLTPLILGIPVVVLDPFEWVIAPETLLQAIEDHRCTLAWLPNFAFHHLVRTRKAGSRHDLTSVRAWINCSEPCRSQTFDLFAETFKDCGVSRGRLHVCYAMAETVFAVSQTKLGRTVSRLRVDRAALQTTHRILPSAKEGGLELLSAGRILPGLTVKIVDDQGDPLPSGHAGEIAVAGDFVSAGYYGLPQRTAEKFKSGVYRTGDRGFFWQDELYVLGRQDDVMIINGRNFYCHELEHIVSTIPQIRPGRVAAFSIEDHLAGTDAAVVVAECADFNDVEETKVKRQIRETLLSQCDLALREIALVPPGWIVKTTSGKISRVENRAKYLSERNADESGGT